MILWFLYIINIFVSNFISLPIFIKVISWRGFYVVAMVNYRPIVTTFGCVISTNMKFIRIGYRKINHFYED